MSDMTQRFENGNLKIAVARTPAVTTVTWSGESDSRNPVDFLNPLIAKLSKDLVGQNVVIDFSELTYMNSATVAPLINTIKALDGAAASVLVVFSDMDWQRTHVQCVRTIARALKKVKIEVKPRAASAG
jgi:anti-anti-sigma regulatory factor